MGEWVKHGMSAHDIYEYLSTGRGTEKLDDAQHATFIELQQEESRAQLIRKQGDLIRDGWQGSASDGAFGAAAPLADRAIDGVTLLARAQDLLDRQSGSFHRAANSVTPVPEEPPGIDLTDPASVFTDYEAEVKAYQSQVQHNFDVYGVYDGASEYNETNMPGEYSTVNHAGGGDITVTSGDSEPSDTGDYIEVRDQPRRGGDAGPYGGGPGPGPGGSPVSGPPVSGPIPNPSLPQQTTPSPYVPPPVNPPGPYPPNPYQPTPNPGPPGYGPSVPVGGFPGGSPGAGRGGGYSGGYGPRGSGYGAGGGNPGPGGAAGPGGRGAVPGPGPGSAAIAAEEAAARRAAAAAAAARGAGPGGMAAAPVGAGRGKGDEDEEHQRKVLIETDGESLFGSDVLTAPQVIGDDEYEDD